MDPLSITASAIAILQLTQSIIIGTNNFYQSARDCPAEIRGLLDELTSFEKVLESLHSMVEKANGIHVSKPFLMSEKETAFTLQSVQTPCGCSNASRACVAGHLIPLEPVYHGIYLAILDSVSLTVSSADKECVPKTKQSKALACHM